MTIENYRFGHIRVDGREYTTDLIIYPGHIDASWWRREGHLLIPEDLTEVLEAPPEVLVIGTGFSGCMIVPKETLAALRSKGSEVMVARTVETVALFNALGKEGRKVVAALHLTC